MAVLQAGLPSTEQAEWLASLMLDPPEEDRADVRHAHMMSALTGKRADQFMEALPWRARRPVAAPPPVTPASLRNKIDAVMTMLGGRR